METNNINADTYSWNHIDSFSGSLSPMRPAYPSQTEMISIASDVPIVLYFSEFYLGIWLNRYGQQIK